MERNGTAPGRGGRGGWLLVALAAAACSGANQDAIDDAPTDDFFESLYWDFVQDSTHRVAALTGFAGPEAVRYDPDQDVWFVSNFDGDGGERDANGFVSRVSAETGEIQSLRFARGTADRPLHAPRGMYIVGDTLWVADIDGLHAFHRRSGVQLDFVDFRALEPGFLNDVAAAPDGTLYVTDTGKSTVYRVVGRQASVALADSALGNPNGITWDATRELLFVVPWDAGFRVNTWIPGAPPVGFGPRTLPGRMDGIEPIDRRLLVASQSDSTVLLMDGGIMRPLVRVPGRPADIGIDTRRRRVAVPYIALNRVDVWQLPLKD